MLHSKNSRLILVRVLYSLTVFFNIFLWPGPFLASFIPVPLNMTKPLFVPLFFTRLTNDKDLSQMTMELQTK